MGRYYRYCVGLVVVAVMGGVCFGSRVRGEVGLPEEVAGYEVLKCDFHTHTMFSDGEVWPTVRVEEARSIDY